MLVIVVVVLFGTAAVVVAVALKDILKEDNERIRQSRNASDERSVTSAQPLRRQSVPAGLRVAAPGRQAIPPPGVDLRIGYTDGRGAKTERRITVTKVVQDGAGLLVQYVHLQAWCHLRSDRRSFAVDRIDWMERADWVGRRVEVKPTLKAIVAADPQLLQKGRFGTFAWDPGSNRPWMAHPPWNALAQFVDGRPDVSVTVTELISGPEGTFLAVRGRNHETKRTATLRLTQLRSLIDADTGEVIDDNAQEWLLARTKANGRGAEA